MTPLRRCSRAGCSRVAAATLTYTYADRAAVVGPLAAYAEPHSYDLCDAHAGRLTAPRGWEVLRLAPAPGALPIPNTDDLEALADAVREAARPAPQPIPAATGGVARRGHLRAVPTSTPAPGG